MPTLSTSLAYAGVVFISLVIPGPSVLYIATRSAANGRSGGFVSVLGVATGSVVHVIAAVAGLSAVLAASATAFTAVKIGASVYLVVLGVATIATRNNAMCRHAGTTTSLRRLFLDGFVINLLNPKVALFFLALLPQFVDPARGPIWSQITVFGVMYVALGVVNDAGYAVVGARIGEWFARRPRFREKSRFFEGGVLVALGASTLAVPSSRT